jgi:hypothetical protein
MQSLKQIVNLQIHLIILIRYELYVELQNLSTIQSDQHLMKSNFLISKFEKLFYFLISYKKVH